MTTNFDFLRGLWPQAHADAARAESYGRNDPRSAVFYARRVVEQIVIHIYDVESLDVPYRRDLAARINDQAFRRVVGPEVAGKANMVRKVGNIAVHEHRTITEQTALATLRQLYDFALWAAFHYSTLPDGVPTGTAYDPSLIPAGSTGSQPPLSQHELNQLLANFEAKDRAPAEAKQSSDSMQAEIDHLRAEVKAAQSAKAHPAAEIDFDEATTRRDFIDADLLEAGWQLTDERDREYPVSGMPSTSGQGFVDYVLWGDDGLPLAIVEAKRSRVDPAIGQQQARLYADCLESEFGRRPVILWTNGHQHWLWDDAAGYPPRRVSGFFTKDELQLMVQRRQSRLPLRDALFDKHIVERHYQIRAIRAVGESFEAKQREALLVMATGSGKTRTVVALVDQLMKQGWVKRVLFLADRVALVNQAVGVFKIHLISAATVNLVNERNPDGRVFVATYPTMMGLINAADSTTFGPGYFDLIVIDEAHRSVYQKYGALFSWFDALLVGLTATPKDDIDRNTYSLFNLEDGVPTDAYSLDEAVSEGFLVPPVAISMPVKFLRQGIHYAELSEAEKDEWDSLDWGEDGAAPTDVMAEEVNRRLFNADTVDKVLQTLMERGHTVAGGDRLGKTIIFAKNTAHAQFIRQRFDVAYPEFGGQFAQVITFETKYAQSLIDDFSVADKSPHIAISVDMLDTGIDVPEVVNLVFFKLVRSASKFWQMTGRGTRLAPDLYGPGRDKEDFFVFDFCMNLEFFNQPGDGSTGSKQKSLSQRLFEQRVGLVLALDLEGDGESGYKETADGTQSRTGLRHDTAGHLHAVVKGMNTDNFIVRGEREWVNRYAEWSAWTALTPEQTGEIVEHLAHLPSAQRDADEDAKRFDVLVLRIQLGQLDGDLVLVDRLRRTVQQITESLLERTGVPAVQAQVALLDEITADEWWVDVTLPMLELARRRVRGLVQFLDAVNRPPVFTNFEDEIGEGSIVGLRGDQTGTDWERFKAKARAYLAAHEDNLALQRLQRNRQLTTSDLTELEALLASSGAGGEEDIERARQEAHGLGLFIRSLVGLDREAATEAFSEFLTDSRFSTVEIRFVQLIVDELTANGVMPINRLFEAPFTNYAPRGPSSIFADFHVDRMAVILEEVRTHAEPVDIVAS